MGNLIRHMDYRRGPFRSPFSCQFVSFALPPLVTMVKGGGLGGHPPPVELLFIIMALCTIGRRESKVSIVTEAAVFTLIHPLHGHLCATLFHGKVSWMTVLTLEDLHMEVMTKMGWI